MALRVVWAGWFGRKIACWVGWVGCFDGLGVKMGLRLSGVDLN